MPSHSELESKTPPFNRGTLLEEPHLDRPFMTILGDEVSGRTAREHSRHLSVPLPLMYPNSHRHWTRFRGHASPAGG